MIEIKHHDFRQIRVIYLAADDMNEWVSASFIGFLQRKLKRCCKHSLKPEIFVVKLLSSCFVPGIMYLSKEIAFFSTLAEYG